MSLNGSGRFQRRRDSELSAVSNSGQSVHSNFSTQQHRQPPPEPGTGAAFMAQQGWNQRDAFGRPLRNTQSANPADTASHRVTGGRPSAGIIPSGIGTGLSATAKFGGSSGVGAPLPPHRIRFSQERSLRTTYLILLIVVSLCFLLLIALIAVLFATRLIVLNREPAVDLAPTIAIAGVDTGASGASGSITGTRESKLGTRGGDSSARPSVDGQLTPLSPPPGPAPPPSSIVYPSLSSLQPSSLPSPATSPPKKTTEADTDRYQSRVFECELFVLDQANEAYRDRSAFEYTQATQIILRSLTSVLDGSTLRDMNPSASVETLENSDQDLRVAFHLTILVLTHSNIRAEAIRNVLMSEVSALETAINNTKIDRMRISVRMLTREGGVGGSVATDVADANARPS